MTTPPINPYELVEFFNATYPVGSTVLLRKVSIDGYPYQPHKVSYPAYVANSGEPVAFFQDITGYFSICPDFIQYPVQKGGVPA